MYDVAVIGAGINGASVAYELSKANQKVIVFDGNGIAGGGSGAAGAFISPKFSKAGDLKEIIHNAFVFSMKYYKEQFPHLFTETSLIHIAKDEIDNEILRSYKKKTPFKLNNIKSDFKNETVSIQAGIVKASEMCHAMCKHSKIADERVESLIYDDGVWIINEEYYAKNVVLATGAYESIIKEPYIRLRGVWGHRIDVKSEVKNEFALHQFVSISPSKDGVVSIGATHDVHYHPQISQEPYDIQKGRQVLLDAAAKTIDLLECAVIKDYTGLRSGSFDYIPILGRLVISGETLKNKEINFKVKKPKYDEYTYYPNLYMINGSGGYGFVLAPYLANMLCANILSNKKIDDKFNPARFFARWAKKL